MGNILNINVAIQKGINIETAYSDAIKHTKSLVSVDCLKEVVEQATKMEISIYALEWRHKNIEARLNRYKHKADIFVLKQESNKGDNEKMTYCDTRFAATKELSHLIIDSVHTFTEDLGALFSDILYIDPVTQRSEQAQSELLTEVIAVQLLFPWKFRQKCIDDLQKKTTTSLKIAEEFKIPQKRVEWILKDNLHKNLSDIYEEIKSIG